MARLPTLDRVSARIANDPGVRPQRADPSGERLAAAAAAVNDRLVRTMDAEARFARNRADRGFARDFNSFLADHKNDDDPDTLEGRFNTFITERREERASTLSGRHRAEFVKLADDATQDFTLRVRAHATGLRNDRLLAATNSDLREIGDDFSVSDADTRALLEVKGIEALDTLFDSGAVSAVDRDRMQNAFQTDLMRGLADRRFADDPALLLDIEANPEFEAMPAAMKLDYRERAEREVERRANQQEREFLAGFQTYTRALAAGVPVSAEAQARYGDAMIDAVVRDPGARETLKAERDTADLMASDVRTLPTMRPAVMQIARQRLADDLEAPATTDAEIETALIKQRRLQNFDTVMAQVLQARRQDSAGFAVQTDQRTADAFDAFRQEPTAEAFAAYSARLETVQREQGHDAVHLRLLPKSFVDREIGALESAFVSEPEQAAARLAQLSEVSGEDWPRMLAELEHGGLSGDLAAVGYVPDQPGMRTVLVNVARNGGLEGLKKRVDADKRKTIDGEILVGMSDAIRVAGADNGSWMDQMGQTAQRLAYNFHLQGLDPTAAANKAVRAVLTDNFTVVNDAAIQGMVPRSAGVDPELVSLGATAWLDRRFDADNAVPAEIPALNLVQFRDHFRPGMREEDLQSLARQLIDENGRFELTPDGTHAVLVAPGAGMMNGVFGADGRLIAVPVSELTGLGVAAREADRAETRQGSRPPGGLNPQSQLQKLFEGTRAGEESFKEPEDGRF